MSRTREPRSAAQQGFLLGAAAYAMWGLFPLYWTLLAPAGAIEILAHRVCWSLVTMVALTLLLRRTPQLRAILRDRRVVLLLTAAAVVIAFNWGGFIYGVNAGRVVEVSLGYFVNPLVTVLLGVLVLGERLRPVQWAAVGLAGVAVVVLTVDYGHPPWVAVLLAGSFGTYGLMKKKADVGAVESLTLETVVLVPLALGYLVWLTASGRSSFGTEGAGHAVLMVSTGLVTAVPLICFGAAATRVSMTTIGLLQYLAPTLQFVLGLVVFGEQMTPVKWLGFGLVWVALVAFTVEALGHRRSQLRLAAEASAV
ncbi:protein rarD [Marmoricola sp. Leaf446]|uniref:EamA family transporter RarD n=1 Tax=Marmoricola sp. Leaf446 TaxID=1736379 RepID=UPI000701B7B7|nr:EamA family transporter RarD [Marmoricola sp. Leaf446]KQT93662.1 protein rarD [Marmoricola sp. Leaf446]